MIQTFKNNAILKKGYNYVSSELKTNTPLFVEKKDIDKINSEKIEGIFVIVNPYINEFGEILGNCHCVNNYDI